MWCSFLKVTESSTQASNGIRQSSNEGGREGRGRREGGQMKEGGRGGERGEGGKEGGESIPCSMYCLHMQHSQSSLLLGKN
jgi:hypothetical protein